VMSCVLDAKITPDMGLPKRTANPQHGRREPPQPLTRFNLWRISRGPEASDLAQAAQDRGGGAGQKDGTGRVGSDDMGEVYRRPAAPHRGG